MTKKYFFIGGFLILLFGTAVVQFKNTIPEKKIASVAQISIAQVVALSDKKQKTTHRVKVGTTALQLLISTHSVIKKGEKENTFVTSIDKREASPKDHEFWAFYINGKQAQVGAGSYILKNNDTIEWKIETY
jgi:hypothetical protein